MMNWDPSLSSLLAIEEENQETTMSREARHRTIEEKKCRKQQGVGRLVVVFCI